MFHLIYTLSFILLSSAHSHTHDLESNNGLKYVFEIVRHGARAPQADDSTRFPNFKPGELTAQGMRQRFLLGRYNYQRYSVGLGDYLQSSKDIYVQSTDLHRTIQSGNAELWGMLWQANPQRLELSDEQQEDIQDAKGRGMPKFQIRNVSHINKILKKYAVPDGFINVPIHTYMDNSWEDRLGYSNCNYEYTSMEQRNKNNTLFQDLYPGIQDKLVSAFGEEGFINAATSKTLTSDDFKNMEWHQMEKYADTIFSERFALLPQSHNWTKDETYDMNTMITSVLGVPYTDYARELMVTKQMIEPLREIISGSQGITPQPKYRLYSAHDTNIANHLMVYMPSHPFNDIPFAASINLELYNMFGVWFVQAQYNGVPVALRGCEGHGKCQVKYFLKHLEDSLYKGDLRKACEPTYKPTDPDSGPVGETMFLQ